MVFAKRQDRFLEEAGVVLREFFLPSRTSIVALVREFSRLRAEIRDFRPDLLHAHFGTMTGFFAAVAATIPLVITFRGSDLNPSPGDSLLRSATQKLLSQISALRAARIICVSDELLSRLWWGKGRATVIPTGVDTAVFVPRPRNEARADLGWGLAERVVVFNSGGGSAGKRSELAAAAVEGARGRLGEIRFVVLDGTVDPRRIPTILNGADCLLLTSDFEGSPTIVQEALACNLPVVSVDVGDVRARLRGVEPSRIAGRSPRELAEALIQILTSPERSNGREAALRLSIEKTAEEVVEVFREALSRAG